MAKLLENKAIHSLKEIRQLRARVRLGNSDTPMADLKKANALCVQVSACVDRLLMDSNDQMTDIVNNL